MEQSDRRLGTARELLHFEFPKQLGALSVQFVPDELHVPAPFCIILHFAISAADEKAEESREKNGAVGED